jgi:beta-lactamase regulating signal transducer with metallopeptidase domain
MTMHLYDILGAERLSAAVPFLASAVAKAMAIFVLGTFCAMAARGASAATRHMIWTLTLAGGIAAPIVSAFVPRWGIPVGQWASALLERAVAPEDAIMVEPAFPDVSSNAVLALAPGKTAADVVIAVPDQRSSDSFAISTSVTATGTATTIESRSVAITPDVAAPAVAVAVPAAGPDLDPPPSTGVSLGTWLVVIWALGVVVTLVPAVTGLARLALVARRARPVHGGRWALLIPSVMRELDVGRRVRFLELDGPVMPMTWGIFRPVVLLPADDFNSTIDQRLDVLRHELAHVRRYDCLTQLIGQVACAFNWFNPLAWIAARELRVERERACDDEVLRAGAKASAYADYLLRVARSTRIAGAAALGGLAMARPSQMAGRLLAVLDDRRRRDRVSGLASTYAALVACLTVGAVASASPVVAHAEEPVVAADIFAVPPEPVAPAAPAAPAQPSTAPGPAAAFVGETSVTPVAIAAPPDLVAAGAPAPTTASAIAIVTPNAAAAPCDRTSRRGNSSHSNWTSSDNGSKRWVARWSDGDCTYEIEARGDVKFNRDVTDIESISSGGFFTLEQHVGDDTKRLVVRPRDDGTLERVYSENGARREFDSAARTWLAETLVALDRQTAFAVDQRLPAILERGGVDAVLREIELINGDYARRRYYTKLLSMRQLDRGQIKRVVEQAGAQMTSDYELAELLVELSKLDAFGDDSHAAFVTAAKKIGSDYERRRALNALLNRDRLAAPTVEALLDAASTIDSDYELAELLIDVSKRYAINDQTRPTYIKALGSIQSDYEHRRVLSAIVTGGSLTPAVGRTLLEDARRIGSDYELAEFLILMAKKGVLDATTRDAYFAAANTIESDYEHHRALTPLLSRDLLTKEMAKAILASAAKIESDYECSQLLIELANAIPIDEELRPAFEKAAESIQGEYEYGRAMSAVRRRVTR